MDDKRIIELYVERDERAIQETQIKYGKYCLAIAHNILNNTEDAEETVNRLIKQVAEREGVTEELKADNQIEWVGKMNNIRQRATEIINHDIIYN